MVRFGGGAKHILLDFLAKFAVGVGVGVAGDAVVELTRAPVLNDTGTFGNPHMSNYEYITYGLSGVGVSAGVIDLATGGSATPLGFTRHALPVLAGIIFGTYFYEHTITRQLGLRGVDPYDIASHALPPILPSSFPHPTGETFGGPSHPLPGYA